VDLAKLPGKTGPAVDFLREHVMSVKGRVSAKGTQIQVEGLRHKEVKLLLHKFLRHNGLGDHRRSSGAKPVWNLGNRPSSCSNASKTRGGDDASSLGNYALPLSRNTYPGVNRKET